MHKFLKILFFLGFARSLGLIKELVLLDNLGANRELDLLVFITFIVVSVAGFMSSILDNIVLPSLTRYGETVLRSFDKKLSLLTLSSLTIVFLLLTYSGNEDISLTLASLAVSCTLVIVVSSYLGVILMSRGGIENSKVDFLPALTIIIYLVTSKVITAQGVFIAFLVGNVAQMVILMFLTSKKKNNEKNSNTFKEKNHHVLMVIIAQLIVLSFPVLDSFFLINEEGSLASYGFSVRIVGVGMTMLATGSTRTLVPNISKLDEFELNSKINYLIVLFLVLLFISFFLFYVPIPINAGFIDIYLKILIFQLPFYVVNIIAVNIFIARFKYLNVLYISIVGFLSKILFLLFCGQLPNAVIWSSVISVVGPTLFLLSIYIYARGKNSIVYI